MGRHFGNTSVPVPLGKTVCLHTPGICLRARPLLSLAVSGRGSPVARFPCVRFRFPHSLRRFLPSWCPLYFPRCRSAPACFVVYRLVCFVFFCKLTPPGTLPLPCFTLGCHPCTPGLHLRAHPLPHAGGSRLGLTVYAGSPAQAVREWTVNVGFRSNHLRSRPPPQGVPCARCWWFPAGAHQLGWLPCASLRAWIENLWPHGRRELGAGWECAILQPTTNLKFA